MYRSGTAHVRNSGIRFTRMVPDVLRKIKYVAAALSTMKATFEGKSRIFFALDIAPDGDYDAVCDWLSAWENDGVLEYETCEARVAGSFDDGPQPKPNDDAG